MKQRELQNKIDIKTIIEQKKLFVCFQAIVSISRKNIIGYEGLIRGLDPLSGDMIMPADLFEAAKNEGLTLQLDRICRDIVIKEFYGIHRRENDKLLFLNLEASLLDQVAGSNYLMNQVKAHKINPRNIVIEINEGNIEDTEALTKFSDTYRKLGFMLALDDVGTGFSNMDRILFVKPDIIKIDITLVKNLQNDYYKQGVIKSLINLANIIGALVIAEGIETMEEALQIMQLGGQMMQGYFFSKPQKIFDGITETTQANINDIIKAFNKSIQNRTGEEKKKNNQLNQIIRNCIKELSCVTASEFDNKLLELTWSHRNIECAYVLNEDGIQISNTIRYCEENDIKDNLIFYSARPGSDHTMEKYYYPMKSAGLSKYITEPYVSLATGNLCITISKLFKCNQRKYILCVDFNTTEIVFEYDSIRNMNVSNLVFNINGKSITEINSIINKMNEEIIKDSLTNTYNRRYMEERLLVDVFNALNENQPISVILADIDYFKKVNDTYGHLAGDHVLKEFAHIANANIRKSRDWIARYGGEEFLIVLLNADENAAYKVAEKVRKAIEETEFLYNNESIRITASFGTYTLKSNDLSYEQLMDRADKNLYKAKNSGRNKTISQ